MTEREWHRYHVLLDESDDIVADERPEEMEAEVRVDEEALEERIRSAQRENAGFSRAMELGRKRLGWSEDV